MFIIYSIVGSFGYITFAENLSVLSDNANGVILFAYGYDIKTGLEKVYPPLTVVVRTLFSPKFTEYSGFIINWFLCHYCNTIVY